MSETADKNSSKKPVSPFTRDLVSELIGRSTKDQVTTLDATNVVVSYGKIVLDAMLGKYVAARTAKMDPIESLQYAKKTRGPLGLLGDKPHSSKVKPDGTYDVLVKGQVVNFADRPENESKTSTVEGA
jgi:hypothetical protein